MKKIRKPNYSSGPLVQKVALYVGLPKLVIFTNFEDEILRLLRK